MAKYSVLVVDTGQPELGLLEALFLKTPGYRFEVVSADEALRAPGAHKPDIVMLDVETFAVEATSLLSAIRADHPDAPIIILSNPLEESQIRALIKLRVHDWLTKPLNPLDFQNALQGAIRNTKQNNNRVHAVISAVGGAGATTVAISIADIIARKAAKGAGSVGLFDLDFSMGSCGYYLNMRNTVNLEGVITNPSRIDHEFVSHFQQQQDNGFYVCSFKHRGMVTHLNCYELVLRLLDVVTAQHVHTVLDIPYYETEWREDVLAAVNTVTLVTELNLPAIKQTLDLLKTIKALPGASTRPITVLLNKHEHRLFGGGTIKTAKLKELFGATPFEYLPRDSDVLADAMDRGLAPSEINSSTRFLRALSKYVTGKLLAEKVAV